MFFSKKLKQFKELKHCFFSRRGGYSKGIYKGLNCGRGSGDIKKNVKQNLKYIARKMRVESNSLILMHQSHSNKVIEIKKNSLNKKIFSDAIVTKERGIALGVVTADCVPILIYNKTSHVVGCIHAGWKGAFSGIIKKTIMKLKCTYSKNRLYASIGPCIGKRSYEVDLKFFKKFVNKSKKNKKYFSKKSKKKKFFDLRNYVANQLKDLEVRVDHVNHDTFKENNNFFSYRGSLSRKEKDYGRNISVIKLV